MVERCRYVQTRPEARYDTWESISFTFLVALQELPPLPSWYQGRAAIRAFILATSLAGEAAGRWRLLPIRANGLAGFAFYVPEEKRGG